MVFRRRRDREPPPEPGPETAGWADPVDLDPVGDPDLDPDLDSNLELDGDAYADLAAAEKLDELDELDEAPRVPGPGPSTSAAPVAASGQPARAHGPWDIAEVEVDDASSGDRVDLGGLLVPAAQGMQLQLQVEEQTGVVGSALVVYQDSAVQLLAVAAPRSHGLWEETRAQVSADAVRHGGTASTTSGPFGPELRVTVPVVLPDGRRGAQPSRVIGVDGPRWMLRATFLGRAVVEESAFQRLADVVRDVVVVRGGEAMPPGEVIPLRLPPEAMTAAETQPGQPSLDDLRPGPTITETR